MERAEKKTPSTHPAVTLQLPSELKLFHFGAYSFPKCKLLCYSHSEEKFTFYGLIVSHKREKVHLKEPGADLSPVVNDFL